MLRIVAGRQAKVPVIELERPQTKVSFEFLTRASKSRGQKFVSL